MPFNEIEFVMEGSGPFISFSLFQREETFDPGGIFRQMLPFSFITFIHFPNQEECCKALGVPVL